MLISQKKDFIEFSCRYTTLTYTPTYSPKKNITISQVFFWVFEFNAQHITTALLYTLNTCIRTHFLFVQKKMEKNLNYTIEIYTISSGTSRKSLIRRASSSFKHNASFVARLPTIRRHKSQSLHSPAGNSKPPTASTRGRMPQRTMAEMNASAENLGKWKTKWKVYTGIFRILIHWWKIQEVKNGKIQLCYGKWWNSLSLVKKNMVIWEFTAYPQQSFY